MKRSYIRTGMIVVGIVVLGVLLGFFVREFTKPETNPKETTVDILINQKIINISGHDADGWIEDIENSDLPYENISKNEDGTITLSLTETQRDRWIDFRMERIKKTQKEFSEFQDGYRIEFSDAYKTINFYYNLDLEPIEAIKYFTIAEIECGFYQLLSGVENGEWYVQMNVYNSDTGKLVTSGDSNHNLHYEYEDWEKSF